MKFRLTLITALLVQAAAFGQSKITQEEAAKHIGETVTVCGKIHGGKFLQASKSQPTLLNMGGSYPEHLLTVVITPEVRKNFSFKPEEYLKDKSVCVLGKLVHFKGKPEIVISKVEDIQVE